MPIESPAQDRDVFDREVGQLREILERLDGLTSEARRRLRILEDHNTGVDPHWTRKHR